MKCIGFGEFEGKCTNEAGNEYSQKSLWCSRCNKLRIEHISKQFEEIKKKMSLNTNLSKED